MIPVQLRVVHYGIQDTELNKIACRQPAISYKLCANKEKQPNDNNKENNTIASNHTAKSSVGRTGLTLRCQPTIGTILRQSKTENRQSVDSVHEALLTHTKVEQLVYDKMIEKKYDDERKNSVAPHSESRLTLSFHTRFQF